MFSHDMGHGVLLRARRHLCEYEIGTGLAGEDIRARRDCAGLGGDTPHSAVIVIGRQAHCL